MCGTIGLFLGCEAVTTCPLSNLLNDDAKPQPDSDQYRSAFDRWDQRASVRRKPRRWLTGAGDSYFPLELMPVAGHALVQSLSPAQLTVLQLRHLHRYLQFTIDLELKFVNPVVTSLSSHGYGLQMPPGMRLDAMRIYTDEAYHALIATDLLIQSEADSGLRARTGSSRLLAKFHAISRNYDRQQRALLELLFVIVSETLITGTLSQLPRSEDASPGLREAVRDHATDEARHHQFFSEVLIRVWPAVPAEHRVAVASQVPLLIAMFLNPELGEVEFDLIEAGLSREKAGLIVDETHRSPVAEAQRARLAEPTVRAFAAIGALSDARVADAFTEAGLLAPSTTELINPHQRLVSVSSQRR